MQVSGAHVLGPQGEAIYHNGDGDAVFLILLIESTVPALVPYQ